MTQMRWERYPLVAQSPYARSWLSMQGNLGLAQIPVDAYGRALEDYLAFSARDSFSPEAATGEHIARYVHDLSSPPNPRGAKIRVLDTGY
jgi:integrase/recombinase XerD